MSSKTLKTLNKWLFWFWICPGIPVSLYMRNSLAYIVFVSVYAIIMQHLIEWRQEVQSMEGGKD